MINPGYQVVEVVYSGLASLVLGIIQMVAGLFSIALGIGSICTSSSGYYIAYGIWCGFVFFWAGIAGMIAAKHKTIGWITATMTVSMLALSCGVVQFCLGVVAASQDASRTVLADSRIWNIYYDRNNYYIYRGNMCTGNTVFTWSASFGPVDILLLLVGFIEAVIAMSAAIVCCRAICCGRPAVSSPPYGYDNPVTAHIAYAPEGYSTTDSRFAQHHAPYKVTL